MKLRSTTLYLALAITFISLSVHAVDQKRFSNEVEFTDDFPSYEIL
jgi:hypothetical protein